MFKILTNSAFILLPCLAINSTRYTCLTMELEDLQFDNASTLFKPPNNLWQKPNNIRDE